MLHWLVLAAVLLTGSTTLTAAELILTWEYPLDVTPPPASFLVTYRSSIALNTPQQFRLPNLGRASCNGVPTLADLTPESGCGRPPGCLAPGIYSFVIQAEWSDKVSAASNLANCEALPGCTYTYERVTLPPALQALMQGQQGSPKPEEVQKVVDTVAHTPSLPALPRIADPAPTIPQIVDQVQTALNQIPKAPV